MTLMQMNLAKAVRPILLLCAITGGYGDAGVKLLRTLPEPCGSGQKATGAASLDGILHVTCAGSDSIVAYDENTLEKKAPIRVPGLTNASDITVQLPTKMLYVLEMGSAKVWYSSVENGKADKWSSFKVERYTTENVRMPLQNLGMSASAYKNFFSLSQAGDDNYMAINMIQYEGVGTYVVVHAHTPKRFAALPFDFVKRQFKYFGFRTDCQDSNVDITSITDLTFAYKRKRFLAWHASSRSLHSVSAGSGLNLSCKPVSGFPQIVATSFDTNEDAGRMYVVENYKQVHVFDLVN